MHKKGHYCKSCADKVVEEIKSNSKNDNSSSNNSSDNSDKKKKIKYEILNLSEGKKLINQGKDLDDINFSRLSESEREELRDYYKNKDKIWGGDQKTMASGSPLPKILIGVGATGLIIVFLVLLIWIFRPKRTKIIKKKRRSKK